MGFFRLHYTTIIKRVCFMITPFTSTAFIYIFIFTACLSWFMFQACTVNIYIYIISKEASTYIHSCYLYIFVSRWPLRQRPDRFLAEVSRVCNKTEYNDSDSLWFSLSLLHKGSASRRLWESPPVPTERYELRPCLCVFVAHFDRQIFYYSSKTDSWSVRWR